MLKFVNGVAVSQELIANFANFAGENFVGL